MKRKILFLCTGNSCRSQMAEGFAKKRGWDAYSAGTHPEIAVNPNAIQVMKEIGLDISQHKPESLHSFSEFHFNIVASVCDNAKKSCPIFNGSSDSIIHQSFKDPADANGSADEILNEFRNVRDLIKKWVDSL
ncbi:MAG: arsenate reductase ArsC [Candidatus Marinimicrobia bacterium]|nr:arsenate reductase ArsC [Candidatus Neomarinimicrobiota bacterium]